MWVSYMFLFLDCLHVTRSTFQSFGVINSDNEIIFELDDRRKMLGCVVFNATFNNISRNIDEHGQLIKAFSIK